MIEHTALEFRLWCHATPLLAMPLHCRSARKRRWLLSPTIDRAIEKKILLLNANEVGEFLPSLQTSKWSHLSRQSFTLLYVTNDDLRLGREVDASRNLRDV